MMTKAELKTLHKEMLRRQHILQLDSWQVEISSDPDLKRKSCTYLEWYEQRAIIAFREKFDEGLQSNLLWHELGHLVMAEISKFLKSVLTPDEFKHYKELEERAINQFSSALDAGEE